MARLLHVVESLAPSGATTQARLHASAGTGDERTVVSLRPRGPWRRALGQLKAESLNKRFAFDPFAVVAWRRVLGRIQPDAVITHDEASARFVSRAGFGPARWGDLSARDTGIGNATDVCPTSEQNRSRYRAEFEVAPQAPLLVAGLALRRSMPAKEIAWAADLVRVVRPGVRLIVAGDGPGRAAAERFAAEASEPGTVRFVGERADWPELVAAADVVWAPQAAHVEATSAVEARAAGVPVVFAADSVAAEKDQLPAGTRAVTVTDRAGWVRNTLELLDAARPVVDEHWRAGRQPDRVARSVRQWVLADGLDA